MIKSSSCLLMIAGFAMASGVPAQTVPAPALTVFAPPSINAPGAKAVAVPARASSTRAPDEHTPDLSLPALPLLRTGAPDDAHGNPPPTVKVAHHDGDVIEQYYRGGNLYMVHVRPKHGVPYSYYVDKNHDLNRAPGAPPVSPVLYTLLKWGNPPASSDDDSD